MNGMKYDGMKRRSFIKLAIGALAFPAIVVKSILPKGLTIHKPSGMGLSEKLTTKMIRKATIGRQQMRPVRIDGKEYFVVLM